MPQWGQRFLSSLFSLSILIPCAAQLGCLQDAKAPSVERGLAVLLTLLHDEHPDVRRTAAESLGKIGDRSALPVVLPLLTDTVPAVRAAAAQALGRWRRPTMRAVIAGLARSLNRPRQQSSASCGARHRRDRTVAPPTHAGDRFASGIRRSNQARCRSCSHVAGYRAGDRVAAATPGRS